MPEADGVDILVITAKPAELEAFQRVASAPEGGGPGVVKWTECGRGTTAPYLIGRHVDGRGDHRSVAVARPVEAGGRVTAPLAAVLVERLRPRCLAMSGTCAGNPDRVGLGDVVVAQCAYEYDEGRLTPDGLQPDLRQFQMDLEWLRAAQNFSPAGLPSHGRSEPGETWLLERLLAGTDPKRHPAFHRNLSGADWRAVTAALAGNGLIARAADQSWELTAAGRQHILTVRYDRVDGPTALPFAVVPGPVASGSATVADGRIWDRLTSGVESVVGMDREAATIATVAQSHRVRHWLVVKGVADHADGSADERHAGFAARASAEVLLALLTQLVEPRLGIGRIGAEWLDGLRDSGLEVWEPDDVTAVMTASDGPEPPLEIGAVIDLPLVRAGRLRGIGLEFIDLVEAFGDWSAREHRKRDDSGPRVLWIVDDECQVRSMALLATLAGAAAIGLDVLDAGCDLPLAAEAIELLMKSDDADRPAVIGVDLADRSEPGWDRLRDTFRRIRRWHSRRKVPYPTVVLAGTAGQEQQAFDVLRSMIELTPVDLRGRPHQRPNSETGAVGMASANLSAEHVYNRGLPMTGSLLFGRAGELRQLHEAWDDPETHIVAVVAPGGVGKSALINRWLQDLRETDYQGAQKVLAWSFYSQGTRDAMIPADPFISFALDWLGDAESENPLPRTAGPVEKGVRLAELIRSRRTLLVLDGLEPLQYPDSAPAGIAGTFTDVVITTLLEELARPGGAGGLCLITTRVKPPPFEATTVVELGNLDEVSGTSLLENLLGRRHNYTALREAWTAVGGHALGLSLLGRYLREVHGGDLAGRYELVRLHSAAPDGGHAQRVLDLSVQWLEQYHRGPELAILDLIGLFDRPARPDAMDAVITRAAWSERTPGLDTVGGPEWETGVELLRRLGLLDEAMPDLPGALDAHPLVRGYSRDRLRATNEALWRDGHLALFEHFQWRAPEQPETPEDMSLLYAAVSHGCAIGLHQEVFDRIVSPRIWRDTFYSTRTLGLTGSEIVALSHYFEHSRLTQLTSWHRLSVELSTDAGTQILSSAALRLRQVGRLTDARDTCAALCDTVDPETADQGRLADAAFAAGLRCELLVIAGQLDFAATVAAQAIDYADRSGDGYFRMYSRTCRAEAESMRGNPAAADAWYEQARAMTDSKHPFLYSQTLYRYGYHLLESDRVDELPGLDAPEEWGLDRGVSSRLSLAIRRLILAAAHRRRRERGDAVDLGPARRMLDRAVAEFRGVGYGEYFVRALVERVHFAGVTGDADDYRQALDDLRQAGVEVGRGEMDVLAADLHLFRALLELVHLPPRAGSDRTQAMSRISHSLACADKDIERLGYLRRSDMLADLRTRAKAYGIE